MTDPESRKRPRKSPVQARSRATVEAILEATTRILETEGLAGVNTNRVAERAGVSVGSLYQYFPSRDAILAELLRRVRLSMSARMLEASEIARTLPLDQAVPRLMAAAVQPYETRPRLMAALDEVERQLPRDPEVLAERGRVRQSMIDCLSSRGVERTGEVVTDLIAMTRGIVLATVGAKPVDYDNLRGRIERAAMGYLTYRRRE